MLEDVSTCALFFTERSRVANRATSSYRTRTKDRHYYCRSCSIEYVTTLIWWSGHTEIFSATHGGRGGRNRWHIAIDAAPFLCTPSRSRLADSHLLQAVTFTDLANGYYKFVCPTLGPRFPENQRTDVRIDHIWTWPCGVKFLFLRDSST